MSKLIISITDDYGVSYDMYDGWAVELGQSFKSKDSFLIDKVNFYIKRAGSPTGNVVAKLFNTTTDSNGLHATGDALAVSDAVSASGLSTSGKFVTFVFSGSDRINLGNGAIYAVSLSYGGGDSNNYIAVERGSSYSYDAYVVIAGGGGDELTDTYIMFELYGVISPVALFTASQTNVDLAETITFTDVSTHTPTSWSWDFGDDETSTDQNPTHSYSSAGTYTVTLTATNEAGSDTATVDITVSDKPKLTGISKIKGLSKITF